MTAEKLKTFLDHGVELDYKDGSKEAPGNCPFCDKEGKFSVKVETGEWKCWSCRAGSDKGGGNVYTFLRLMYDLYQSPGKEMAALAASRKLLRPQTLDAWGVRKSTTTGDWIVPAFSPNNGKLHNLYRYVKGAGGKYRLWATSGATHGLFGWQFYDAKKPDVYLCEGPWDAMALLEVMRLSKRTQDGNLEETGAESISLYGRSNVLATPGSNVFADAWSNSFAGKRVYLLYDNDHPRMNPKTNKEITPAGLDGMKRVAAMLAKAEEPPLEIHYLQWGENGCDLSLASGYDVRDHLCVGQRAKDRIGQLALLLSKLKPVPPEWIPGRSPNAEPGGVLVDCLPCAEWKVLQTAWKKALKWTPGLDRALACMLASITSVRMPGDQLWLKIVGPPSCGKSTLCEAVSVNKRFVYPKSSIRGFHSGYKTDKEGDEDNSLIPNIKNKTLVTKDGDTLLQSPNLSQILGEARDLYDTTSRTHYRNKTSRDYEDIRMTWLLCGTESLRQLDSSELGERFLDCVMMDQIDDELEDEIGWKAIQKIKATKGYEADDPALKTADNAETMAKQLTGGYINYLRDNAATLLGEVDLTDDASHAIMDLGLFIAYMRSRPSKKQNEGVTREMATRLRIQLTKLACCLAVVMNRKSVDEQVLKYVTDVAMDTSRGRTMDIVRHLYEEGDKGLEMKALAIRTNHTDDDERTLLQFLRRIKVVELFRVKLPTGYASTPKWRLTEKARDLYQKIVHPDKADPSDVEVIPLAEEDDFDPTVETD